jgi:hemoglobin-like flavoprotein
MYKSHLELVLQSIELARAQRKLEALAEHMFAIFFERHPEAVAFFSGFDLAEVGTFKFCKISDALVDVLKYPDYSKTSVSEEVFRHQVHDIQDKEYYFALADAFVQTIKDTLAQEWTARHEEYWNDTLTGLKHNIDIAAREHLAVG